MRAARGEDRGRGGVPKPHQVAHFACNAFLIMISVQFACHIPCASLYKGVYLLQRHQSRDNHKNVFSATTGSRLMKVDGYIPYINMDQPTNSLPRLISMIIRSQAE